MNNNKHEFGIGANTNGWSQCKDEREERGVSFIDWLQHQAMPKAHSTLVLFSLWMEIAKIGSMSQGN